MAKRSEKIRSKKAIMSFSNASQPSLETIIPLNTKKTDKFIPILEARGMQDNDKDEFGHRRDTLPIAHALDQYSEKKIHSAVFQFLEESDGENEVAMKSNLALKRLLAVNAQGIIVRNNPGTLSAFSQKNFDDMLRELANAGLMIMAHPDVMSTLGAKDVSYRLTFQVLFVCGVVEFEE